MFSYCSLTLFQLNLLSHGYLPLTFIYGCGSNSFSLYTTKSLTEPLHFHRCFIFRLLLRPTSLNPLSKCKSVSETIRHYNLLKVKGWPKPRILWKNLAIFLLKVNEKNQPLLFWGFFQQYLDSSIPHKRFFPVCKRFKFWKYGSATHPVLLHKYQWTWKHLLTVFLDKVWFHNHFKLL